MKTHTQLLWIGLVLTAVGACKGMKRNHTITIFKGATIITVDSVLQQASLAIQDDTIAGIFSAGDPIAPDATVIDYTGKTIMPMLINGHGHLGLLQGDSAVSGNYTRENIIRQLKKYASFGVGSVMSMGTDHALIFPLRDSSQKGLIPGATIFTAGYGLGVNGGGPPPGFADKVMRPQGIPEAIKDIQQLAALHPDLVKVWVDDFSHTAPKMKEDIYDAIIQEAHNQHLRVAAHVFYQEDARRLVNAGVSVLAHSIRDTVISDSLVLAIKQKGVFYIPTLTLDEYNFAYGGDAYWLNDAFFKRSLEPGVWERLSSAAFKEKQLKDSTRQKKITAFKNAVTNLHKLDSAGVTIVLGTDSGAQPVRAQGFSEHLELELMEAAGVSPMHVIQAATINAARMLQVTNRGNIAIGKKADLLVLNGNPLNDIRQTRNIAAVWKNGVLQK
ncbi:amidohydrolase family protein [Deminuibacter soli]|uniref:Amidohydrolase n=1 Tax=Deminuibacter soli TaxID=2291815 RepID=A0A3E1NQV3_9BACT|nr:amidohydrolase family protein [Deminuibacter soli]RFM30301.1 amidohydrolase [Deminuibacter soli]